MNVGKTSFANRPSILRAMFISIKKIYVANGSRGVVTLENSRSEKKQQIGIRKDSEGNGIRNVTK